jgi:FAD/FMN-containing dehydrogenase
MILPTYPASRELCTLGGMVANNAGGEKSLKYGKTEDYVLALRTVFADGQEYLIKPLSEPELKQKMRENSFEGDIYRRIFELIRSNFEVLSAAKPRVSKNSAGYFLWNVWDKKKGVFDLTKLLVGSQGTLGIITEIKFRLIPVPEASAMAVIYLQDRKDLAKLPRVIEEVLGLRPASLESYDEHTLRLALRFLGDFVKILGKSVIAIAFGFLPDLWLAVTKGVPKLVLIAEFEENQLTEAEAKVRILTERLKGFGLKTKMVLKKSEAQRYWVIRRESFNLLRKRVRGKKAAPFIDDVVVPPERLDKFLPALYSILNKYGFFYTVAGHAGNGNFHIIPLMNLENQSERENIFRASDEVYDLTLRYGGSITAEHNDGIIRTPYLEKMYGKKVYSLFEATKKVFDPQNIFNPGKKVGMSLTEAKSLLKTG